LESLQGHWACCDSFLETGTVANQGNDKAKRQRRKFQGTKERVDNTPTLVEKIFRRSRKNGGMKGRKKERPQVEAKKNRKGKQGKSKKPKFLGQGRRPWKAMKWQKKRGRLQVSAEGGRKLTRSKEFERMGRKRKRTRWGGMGNDITRGRKKRCKRRESNSRCAHDLNHKNLGEKLKISGRKTTSVQKKTKGGGGRRGT